MHFDFTKLLDGLKRNNVGLAGIKLLAIVSVSNGALQIHPSGQVLSLSGKPPAESGESRQWLNVLEWQDKAKTKAEIIEDGVPSN